MRARWYDPATGRFISEDSECDGDNWYVYCDNNPLNLTDPSGNFCAGEIDYDAAVISGGFAALAGVMMIIAGYQAATIIATHQTIGCNVVFTNQDENAAYKEQLRKRGIDPRSDLGRSIHDEITGQGLTAKEIGEIADAFLKGSRMGQKNTRGGKNK